MRRKIAEPKKAISDGLFHTFDCSRGKRDTFLLYWTWQELQRLGLSRRKIRNILARLVTRANLDPSGLIPTKAE